ncbi:MAG: LysM peptidoglycan-binding domain-containing protein [Luteolibacter sp.]|uniref:LysM peptidoglycan-binding domain-containing protein n=1 Tax=Luteolibacter sp. TaxID=1962973 RepID=UPI003264FF5C
MKPTLLFATLSMVLASPTVHAKSELETLRSLCKEQERQIHQLEDDNAKLRDSHAAPAKSAPAASTVVNAVAAKTAASVAAATPAPAATTYTVKAGDSFEKIARKVGTSPEKLAKNNGLKTSAMIRPGQKLKVPGAPAAATSTQAVAQSTPSTPKSSAKSHVVKPGETFFSISKKHGISTAELAAANPKVKASALRPGQVVSLGGEAPATTMISTAPAAPSNPHAYPEKAQAPVSKSPAAVPNNIPISTPTAPKPAATPAPKPASAPKPTAPAETKPAVAESAPAPAPTASSAAEKKVHPVTIDGEMTYGEFASKHGTDTERLNALNGLDLTNATVLAKGSELYVPAQP